MLPLTAKCQILVAQRFAWPNQLMAFLCHELNSSQWPSYVAPIVGGHLWPAALNCGYFYV